MKLTIGRRVILGFATTILITVILGFFALNRVSVLGGHAQSLARESLPGVYYSALIRGLAKENYIIALRYIIAEDEKAMAALDQQSSENSAKIDEAVKGYEDSITTEEDRRTFAPLAPARLAFREARKAAIGLAREKKDKEAQVALRASVDPAYQNMMTVLNAVVDYNKKIGDNSGQNAIAAGTASKTGVWVGLGTAAVVSFLVAFFIIRSVNKALNRIASSMGEGSSQVAAASTQVASSSQSLAQGASEQAAALEETTSALEQMASMTRKNSETAQQAASLSGDARNSAAKGNNAMTKMSSAINDIQKSASETAKIIKVIDEIAFQTNLLALNAAVEAARAGEAGKGFAVVAEEVRNLAMRSAEAAKNTASMIEESVNNAKNGVTIAVEVGKNLEEITTAATKVNSLVGEIAAASKEQSQGIDQVNTAVSQMDKVTQSNAASAEQSAAAAEELSSQSIQLTQMVRELVSLVGSAKNGAVSGNEARAQQARQQGGTQRAATRQKAAPTKLKRASKGEALIPFEESQGASDHQSFKEFDSVG